MEAPVDRPVSGLIAGLFGKLPAHGDFVRRGWPDETVDAVDRWLTDTIGAARASRNDAAFAAWMRAAPLWRGYVPPGKLGPYALHVAVAPSIDRAGRLFLVAAGVVGDAGASWSHAEQAGEAVDAAIYDALAGRADADETVRTIATSVDLPLRANPPAFSAWWLAPDGAPALASETVDTALLERLLCEGQA